MGVADGSGGVVEYVGDEEEARDLGGDGGLIEGERLGEHLHDLARRLGVVDGEAHDVADALSVRGEPAEQVLKVVALLLGQALALAHRPRRARGAQRPQLLALSLPVSLPASRPPIPLHIPLPVPAAVPVPVPVSAVAQACSLVAPAG
mgnify:CR=1 FL=1